MSERPDACAAVQPLLESYLDGELSPAETEGVREHLAHCPACEAERVLAEAIQIGLRALPELDAPPAVLTRVRAAAAEIEAETAAKIEAAPAVLPFERPALPKLRKPSATPFRFARFGAVAAALVLALFGALLFFQPRSPRRLQPPQPPQLTAAEIARATAEARYAFACVGRASRRAGLALRDDVLPERLLAPAAHSLSRSLGETLNPDSAPKQGS